jgi:transcription initiation factor TFIIE subunit alpha
MVDVQDLRVREYIQDVVGDEGVRVAELLEQKGDATDVQLAEVLQTKPSHVRKILYSLYEARAAEYRKEKDKETGWLTFHWLATPDQALHAIDVKVKREIGSLEEQIRSIEGRDFYACPQGQERFDFTEAANVEFRCPAHGELLQAQDNRTEIEQMRGKLQSLVAYLDRIHNPATPA